MSRPDTHIALCAAIDIDREHDADGVPEFVHLLPAGDIRTTDGRGPYKTTSLHSVAARLKAGEKLPIDECHATDVAAPKGQPAPARGWIVALQAREDGVWGKVEWTGEGRKLMADKAYRGISPVILHTKDKTVLGVLRASLTNTPNLVGLASLHSGLPSEENEMDWKAKLIEALGLGSDADDEAISAALTAKLKGGEDKPETALQSVIQHPSYVAMQSALTETQDQVKSLTDSIARGKAEAYVDGAIAEGRVGLNATVRDEYVSLHMANPEQAERLIGTMPKIGGATVAGQLAPVADEGGLTASQRQVIALMGISEEDYKASLAASGQKVAVL